MQIDSKLTGFFLFTFYRSQMIIDQFQFDFERNVIVRRFFVDSFNSIIRHDIAVMHFVRSKS